MNRLCVAFATLVLCACASEPESMYLPPPEGLPQANLQPAPLVRPMPEGPLHLSIAELQSHLGLAREPQSLGFDEKSFDGCRFGLKEDGHSCGPRYLSVVHFRLLCRDSVETVQYVPSNFTPLVADRMQWRLGGERGSTHTDSQGFGQVKLISQRPTKGQRFMLIIGTKSLGLEAGEVNQIILPRNWCSGLASTEKISIPDLSNFVAPFIITDK